MRLDPDLYIEATIHLRVGSKRYVLSSVKGVDKSLKGRIVVVAHEGLLYLGRIITVDEYDVEYTYRVRCLKPCGPEMEEHDWHAARDIFPIGKGELEGLKTENPEMFL